MAAFDSVCRMATVHADLVDFLVIYIEEAHATDGWAVAENAHQISSHRNIEDRLAAAAELSRSFTLPANMTVVADSMSGDLNRAYGALPERLYVIQSGLVVFEGGPGPFKFSPDELDDWLKTCRERNSSDKNDIDGVTSDVSG